jgi:hypothetical protein
VDIFAVNPHFVGDYRLFAGSFVAPSNLRVRQFLDRHPTDNDEWPDPWLPLDPSVATGDTPAWPARGSHLPTQDNITAPLGGGWIGRDYSPVRRTGHPIAAENLTSMTEELVAVVCPHGLELALEVGARKATSSGEILFAVILSRTVNMTLPTEGAHARRAPSDRRGHHGRLVEVAPRLRPVMGDVTRA